MVCGAPGLECGLRFFRGHRQLRYPEADHHVPVTPRLWVGGAVAIGDFMHGSVERDTAPAAENCWFGYQLPEEDPVRLGVGILVLTNAIHGMRIRVGVGADNENT